MADKKQIIIEVIKKNHPLSSKEIHEVLALKISYASVKRILKGLLEEGLISSQGSGKATKYILSPNFLIIQPIYIEEYFKREIDERIIKQSFDFSILDELKKLSVFTSEENEHLLDLHKNFLKRISLLSPLEIKKEQERLAIDLSWKSSQIEGNTYSLLETELLLKEKQTAEGKTKDEAIMLLNHKEALDFILENPEYIDPLSLAKIETIHSVLIKELGIDKNIRRGRVGITGTNYVPLDNEFQIKEALIKVCELVNLKQNVFEKALLLLLLISYIQPFVDGNKRTARIVSNAILVANNYCPMSFRTVDSIEYKKAMLIFYEQNNIYSFKKIFIEQFEFAVKTYF
jgi:Fic family protein